MARGVNKVIIVGNLGADPETNYTGSGTAITTIRVATSEKWKDKEGEEQERTEWHRIKFFGRLAEVAGEYLTKGRQVYVEGKLQTDKYTDKDGVERYTTNIIANEMQMLGGGGDRDGGQQREQRSEGQQSRGNAQRQQQASQSGQRGGNSSAQERARQAREAGAQERPPAQQQAGFDDDDIPF